MNERGVEALLRREVRRLGGRCEKLAPTTAGIPDRLVLLPGGRVILVELKDTGGKLRPAQVLWHRHAKDLGTDVVVLSGRMEVLQWIWIMQREIMREDKSRLKEFS